MPKRKRGERSLEESITKWHKELTRGLKLAKCFERQRQNKRLREADDEKKARLEKEILVLKSLDLNQTAHAHLCSSLLRIKRIAESPKLPPEIKPAPKPDLSDEEKTALHNVTSALYNRKQAKDVIDAAIAGTCHALGVPLPGKGKKSKSNGKEEIAKKPIIGKGKQANKKGDESEGDEESEPEGLPLLRRKVEKVKGEEELESDEGSKNSEGSDFGGFSNSDAEEEMFSKYDALVGGSSDSDDSDEEAEDDDESDHVDSRARSFRKLALDEISLSSEASDDSDASESEALVPAVKKTKVKAVRPTSFNTGSSAFLPSLMGGYVSGSESASDVDVAPPRKNRRGQRARQAIWDKKYGEKAKHHEKGKDARNSGWDMKRGAVDDDRGGSKPWKNGIRNPFEKSQVHPERQQQMQSNAGDRQGHDRGTRDSRARPQPRQQDRNIGGFQSADKPKPRPPPTRDDSGSLHPSWAAAKKAKEVIKKVEFQGKKVTFD